MKMIKKYDYSHKLFREESVYMIISVLINKGKYSVTGIIKNISEIMGRKVSACFVAKKLKKLEQERLITYKLYGREKNYIITDKGKKLVKLLLKIKNICEK